MNKPAPILFLLLIIIISAAGGFYASHLYSAYSQDEIDTDNNQTQQPHRPDFSLRDLDGKLQSIDNWNGKVIMVNFWASWCPPCRREIPAFIRLYKNYQKQGLVILGVAIDDTQSVRDFADSTGINYPVLLGEEGGIEISSAYGNQLGALPFTVIINREGRIIRTHPGELSYKQAEALIKPLL
ncbi:MAG TPA: TlpA family protein disulfide reductase [Gammaproteobacteria bacterium]|nr:TlpA family protein disulfide reductase [Gammaproteobacteria bacterium]